MKHLLPLCTFMNVHKSHQDRAARSELYTAFHSVLESLFGLDEGLKCKTSSGLDMVRVSLQIFSI